MSWGLDHKEVHEVRMPALVPHPPQPEIRSMAMNVGDMFRNAMQNSRMPSPPTLDNFRSSGSNISFRDLFSGGANRQANNDREREQKEQENKRREEEDRNRERDERDKRDREEKDKESTIKNRMKPVKIE